MYDASVWLWPMYKRNLDMLLCGSIGIALRLGRMQRAAAISILGAMHSSPLDSLEVHAFLQPMTLLIQDLLYRSVLHMARLPKTHLLHQKLKWIKKHNVRQHCQLYTTLDTCSRSNPPRLKLPFPTWHILTTQQPSPCTLWHQTRTPSVNTRITKTLSRYSQMTQATMERLALQQFYILIMYR